jgi:hypothetical protein
MGTYTITATYTPLYGSPFTGFTVISLTVQCSVSTFTKPSNPSNLQYIVYDSEMEFNMNTLVYTQSPQCNYPYTAVYTWGSGTNNYITVDGSDSGIIHISSLLPESASTSNMAVTATIIIADNNGVSN